MPDFTVNGFVFKNDDECLRAMALHARENGADNEVVHWLRTAGSVQQAVDKCPSELAAHFLEIGLKQFEEAVDWEKLTSFRIMRLLIAAPEYVTKCDVRRMNLGEVITVLKAHEDLLNYMRVDCWSEYSVAQLLSEMPGLIDSVSISRICGACWVNMVIVRPDMWDRCPKQCLGGRDWCRLVKHDTQYAEHCDWSVMDAVDRASVLCEHPELLPMVDIDDFTGTDIFRLIRVRPCMFDDLPVERMSNEQMRETMKWCPQARDMCDWSHQSPEDVYCILRGSPGMFGVVDHTILCREDWDAVVKRHHELDGKWWGKFDAQELTGRCDA